MTDPIEEPAQPEEEPIAGADLPAEVPDGDVSEGEEPADEEGGEG